MYSEVEFMTTEYIWGFVLYSFVQDAVLNVSYNYNCRKHTL